MIVYEVYKHAEVPLCTFLNFSFDKVAPQILKPSMS